MTASASQDALHEDLPRSISRLARGLSAGAIPVAGAPGGFRSVEAVAEALAAAARQTAPEAARATAYRTLVRRFLAEADDHGAGAPAATPRAAQPVQAGAAAMRARPAPEPARMMVALAGLAPVERAALLLVAVERFPWREAADFMEISEADLARALARAREALAARLAAAAAQGRPHLRLVE